MFLTMNRFKVRPGNGAVFEALWMDRLSHLRAVPGFVSLHVMRGAEAEDHTLFATHTTWTDKAAFRAWTRSEAYVGAHKVVGNRNLYLEPPQLELFEAVRELH